MVAKPQAGECYEKALELLARRAHFLDELASKLGARGFSQEEIKASLLYLQEQGLIDDRKNALELACGSMTRKGFGPRRMRAELQRRGVSAVVSQEVVSEVFPDRTRELESAKAEARGRLARGKEARSRLARRLDRKGYSKSVILQVLEELEAI